MEIAVIGISYHKANLDVRSAASFMNSEKLEFMTYMQSKGIEECHILSTCNRSEIYVASEKCHLAIEVVKQIFKQKIKQVIDGDAENYLYVKQSDDALHHLFQLAIGLDSQIIGEDEILGQLKKSLEFSIEHQASKKYLNKLIRESITFAKKMKAQYKLSENQLSIAAISVQYIHKRYMDTSNLKVMIVGKGELGQRILTYLLSESYEQILVAVRNFNEEFELFNSNSNCRMVAYQDRYLHINEMDIVISATSSPHFVIERSKLAMRIKPLLCLDLAVPRDIETSIDTMNAVEVITMDDLIQISESNKQLRQDLSFIVQKHIQEEVSEFKRWMIRARGDSIIQQLHSDQHMILEEIECRLKKIGLTSEQENEVREIIQSCMWKIIKKPVNRLKNVECEQSLNQVKQMIEQLFH